MVCLLHQYKLILHPLPLFPPQALSLILIVVGFITFYGVPLTFVTGDFAATLHILNGILLGMLVGLSILSQLIQPFVEKAIVRMLVFCAQGAPWTSKVLDKNLSAHESRNRKTSSLLSLATSFLIFAGVLFALQTSSILDNVRWIAGSDIVVNSPSRAFPVPWPAVRDALE